MDLYLELEAVVIDALDANFTHDEILDMVKGLLDEYTTEIVKGATR